MYTKRVLDGQPGQLPRIIIRKQEIIYSFSIVGIHDDQRLNLRISPSGDVWLAVINEQNEERPQA